MIFPSNIPMIMSYLHRLLASAIGAGIAEATTLPTDVAKVRKTLQQNGEVWRDF